MKALEALAIYSVVMGLALLSGDEADAGPGCELTVKITNGFDTPITLVKAELAVLRGYATKWEGEQALAAGQTIARKFSTGSPCSDRMGNARKWKVRFQRKNDVKHTCTNMAANSGVKLSEGGACSVR